MHVVAVRMLVLAAPLGLVVLAGMWHDRGLAVDHGCEWWGLVGRGLNLLMFESFVCLSVRVRRCSDRCWSKIGTGVRRHLTDWQSWGRCFRGAAASCSGLEDIGLKSCLFELVGSFFRAFQWAFRCDLELLRPLGWLFDFFQKTGSGSSELGGFVFCVWVAAETGGVGLTARGC